MDSKKILESLVKIANSQQKIIHKLAQQTLPPDSLPSSHVGVEGGHSAPPVSPTPPASLKPNLITKTPAATIIGALGDFFHQNVRVLEVPLNSSEVRVAFKPGKDSQENFNHIVSTVNKLQQSNALPGKSYAVKSVG
jgi:hypothetical protein